MYYLDKYILIYSSLKSGVLFETLFILNDVWFSFTSEGFDERTVKRCQRLKCNFVISFATWSFNEASLAIGK